MFIRGVDAQIMVQRTTDFSRDANAVQKREETTHNYLAIQNKSREEQEKITVAGTQETSETQIRPDEDGAEGEYKSSGRKKQGKEAEEEGELDQNEIIMRQLRVTDSMFDITI